MSQTVVMESPTRWRRCRVAVYVLVGLALADLAVVLTHPGWGVYDTEVYPLRTEVGRSRGWDLAAVGGSPVSEGVDVRLLRGVVCNGRPVAEAVNLGLPGGTAADTWLAVRHGLPQTPRVLLYGVTASDFNDGRAEPSGARSIMEWDDLSRWWEKRPGHRGWAVRHYARGRLGGMWQLYRRRSLLRMWAAEHAEKSLPGCCPEAARDAAEEREYHARLGEVFAPRPGMRHRRLDELKRANWLPNFTFLANFRVGEYLTYLEAIMDWCAQRGVELVLIDMPVSADLEERLHPSEYRQYREALSAVTRGRAVRALRATREGVGLGDADFADLVHLNASGSAKFGAWLRGELAGRPGQGDRRAAR